MSKTDDLKELISEDLNDNEVILWTGKPAGIKLLDMPYGTSVIIRWIIGLVFVVFGLWYQFVFIPSAKNPGMSGTVFMLVCFVIAAVIALMPLMEINKLKNKCAYYITNQRALVYIKASSEKRNIKEKKYEDVSEISSDIIADSRGNIYVGAKLKNSHSKARGYVLSPPGTDEEGKERPLIFHSVVDPEKVIAIFPSFN